MRTSVLVIDDDPLVREVLCEMLRGLRRPLDVSSAADGNDGVNLFRKSPRDVVITDIFMPGQEGHEVIGELRRIHPDVRIIAISGGGGVFEAEDALMNAKRIGAHATLSKPFTKDALESALDSVLA